MIVFAIYIVAGAICLMFGLLILHFALYGVLLIASILTLGHFDVYKLLWPRSKSPCRFAARSGSLPSKPEPKVWSQKPVEPESIFVQERRVVPYTHNDISLRSTSTLGRVVAGAILLGMLGFGVYACNTVPAALKPFEEAAVGGSNPDRWCELHVGDPLCKPAVATSAGHHNHVKIATPKPVDPDAEPVVDYTPAGRLGHEMAAYDVERNTASNNLTLAIQETAQDNSCGGIACGGSARVVSALGAFEEVVVAYYNRIDAEYTPQLIKIHDDMVAQRQWLVAHGQSTELIDQSFVKYQRAMADTAALAVNVGNDRRFLEGFREQTLPVIEHDLATARGNQEYVQQQRAQQQ